LQTRIVFLTLHFVLATKLCSPQPIDEETTYVQKTDVSPNSCQDSMALMKSHMHSPNPHHTDYTYLPPRKHIQCFMSHSCALTYPMMTTSSLTAHISHQNH
jgi:hypothetical protein